MVLDKWNYLRYQQRINAAWNHQITVECSSDDPLVTKIRSIKKDYFVVIYRTDPITFNKDLVYEGFNYTRVDQVNKAGDVIFNLYGAGYTSLLNRRIVIPPDGLEQNVKTGKAESVAKGFVYDCCIGSIADRQIQGLTIEYDSATGNLTTQSIRYINLLTVIENSCSDGDVDFGIVGSVPPGNFEFQVRPVWGTDHRIGNPDGNVPLVFDLKRNNMEIPIFSYNSSEEKNYIYIGGQNSGVDRIIKEVADPEAISDSPWGRKEMFDDARREDTDDGLIASGNASLKEHEVQKTLSFNSRQTTGTRWLRNWKLGDLFNAVYFDETFEKQCTEVTVTVTSGGDAEATELVEMEMIDV